MLREPCHMMIFRHVAICNGFARCDGTHGTGDIRYIPPRLSSATFHTIITGNERVNHFFRRITFCFPHDWLDAARGIPTEWISDSDENPLFGDIGAWSGQAFVTHVSLFACGIKLLTPNLILELLYRFPELVQIELSADQRIYDGLEWFGPYTRCAPIRDPCVFRFFDHFVYGDAICSSYLILPWLAENRHIVSSISDCYCDGYEEHEVPAVFYSDVREIRIRLPIRGRNFGALRGITVRRC